MKNMSKFGMSVFVLFWVLLFSQQYVYAVPKIERVKVWGAEKLKYDQLNSEFDNIKNYINTHLLNGGTTWTVLAGDSLLVQGRGVLDTIRVRTILIVEGHYTVDADGAYNIASSSARIDTMFSQHAFADTVRAHRVSIRDSLSMYSGTAQLPGIKTTASSTSITSALTATGNVDFTDATTTIGRDSSTAAITGGSASFDDAFNSLGIDDNASSTTLTLDGNGNIGVGDATPDARGDFYDNGTTYDGVVVDMDNASTVKSGIVVSHDGDPGANVGARTLFGIDSELRIRVSSRMQIWTDTSNHQEIGTVSGDSLIIRIQNVSGQVSGGSGVFWVTSNTGSGGNRSTCEQFMFTWYNRVGGMDLVTSSALDAVSSGSAISHTVGALNSGTSTPDLYIKGLTGNWSVMFITTQSFQEDGAFFGRP